MSGPRSYDDPLRGRWLGIITAYVFLVLILGITLGNLLAAQALGEIWAPVGSSLGFVLATAVAVYLVHVQDPNGRVAIGLDALFRGLRRGVLLWLPITLVVTGVQIVLGLTLRYLGVDAEAQGAIELFTSAETPQGLKIGLVVVAAILAPIAEEILFRGLLHDLLRRRLGFVPAAVLGSLLFGAMHIESAQTVYFVLPLAFLGFLLCWLREDGPRRRGGGNLWSCILVHALHNSSQLALALSLAGQGELVPK